MFMTELDRFKDFAEQEGLEGKLVTHKIVCPRCRGKGQHVNPAIDGNGITREDREDWADDDFMEDYLAGHYDVRCEECDGKNVVDEVVENGSDPIVYAEWIDWERGKYELEAEYAAERRMGA